MDSSDNAGLNMAMKAVFDPEDICKKHLVDGSTKKRKPRFYQKCKRGRKRRGNKERKRLCQSKVHLLKINCLKTKTRGNLKWEIRQLTICLGFLHMFRNTKGFSKNAVTNFWNDCYCWCPPIYPFTHKPYCIPKIMQ